MLGLASPLLIVAGWLWGFLLFDLGLLAAVVSVFYGVRAMRRPRGWSSRALAATGLVLALLTLAIIIFFFVTFAINPPE